MAAKSRTLEDVMVSAIQRAPRQAWAKLNLADLLEEEDYLLEANALRWCAAEGKWPQRRPFEVDAWRRAPRGQPYTGSQWQWWHPYLNTTGRPSPLRRPHYPARRHAVVPEGVVACWPPAHDWAQPTWFEALTVLGQALVRAGLLSEELYRYWREPLPPAPRPSGGYDYFVEADDA